MRTVHAQASGKRMRPVARMPIEFNGEGTTRFYYRRLRDADDDLERLLANKRAREINSAFMQYNVNQEMSQCMDTGVRVNRALAGMYGINASAASSSSDPPKLKKVPADAQLLVIGEAMSESTVTERDMVLVGIVV